jgi:anti-anti-sigma factor
MTGDDPGFCIETTQGEGAVVITVTGEIDLTSADALQRAVEETTSPTVALDLGGVSFLDSSGIRAIDRSLRRLVSEGRSLLIVSPPDSASAWTLRVAGFDRGLLVASVDAALATGAPPG